MGKRTKKDSVYMLGQETLALLETLREALTETASLLKVGSTVWEAMDYILYEVVQAMTEMAGFMKYRGTDKRKINLKKEFPKAYNSAIHVTNIAFKKHSYSYRGVPIVLDSDRHEYGWNGFGWIRDTYLNIDSNRFAIEEEVISSMVNGLGNIPAPWFYAMQNYEEKEILRPSLDVLRHLGWRGPRDD